RTAHGGWRPSAAPAPARSPRTNPRAWSSGCRARRSPSGPPSTCCHCPRSAGRSWRWWPAPPSPSEGWRQGGRAVPWTLERETGRARVVLTDTVDVFEARGLHRALVMLAPLAVPIHVDLARCRDLDSSILQLLLALHRARDTAGHALVLE